MDYTTFEEEGTRGSTRNMCCGLCACIIRVMSNIQLWLILHPNFITRFFLWFFYVFEVLAYSINPKSFLNSRSDVLGKNYAALGKIIIGDYRLVAGIIEGAQKRGAFLGRARLAHKKVASAFPLFLSDEGAGGTSLHSTIHQNIWALAQPALDRAHGPEFDKYVEDGVREYKRTQKNGALNDMTAKYVFHAVFGAPLPNKKELKNIQTLFIGNFPWSSYVFGAVKPFSALFHCFQCSRTSRIKRLKEVVLATPLLLGYVPSEANGHLSADEYAEMLVSVCGIAGILGTSNLIKNVAKAIPENVSIDLSDQREVMRAVLEAARIRAPVNNVNVLTTTVKTMRVNNKLKTLPMNTVFAGSIGLACFDESVFANPKKYDHKRENIEKAVLNFNHVGFSPEGAGTRQCPGRNIAMKLAADFLIGLRTPAFVENIN
uniref:Cytochrome P450 n=1 Tax=Chaetoceros debilis TaxID=122233 RepID=A0A7S3QBI4_9STRA|mmetsp:Transcript_21417/g.32533  ORF Transcript_21417/g.32533 Transcript_21417/m.32533 type:complete len:431 (-) Transcript_21417:116-1408(-)